MQAGPKSDIYGQDMEYGLVPIVTRQLPFLTQSLGPFKH